MIELKTNERLLEGFYRNFTTKEVIIPLEKREVGFRLSSGGFRRGQVKNVKVFLLIIKKILEKGNLPLDLYYNINSNGSSECVVDIDLNCKKCSKLCPCPKGFLNVISNTNYIRNTLEHKFLIKAKNLRFSGRGIHLIYSATDIPKHIRPAITQLFPTSLLDTTVTMDTNRLVRMTNTINNKSGLLTLDLKFSILKMKLKLQKPLFHQLIPYINAQSKKSLSIYLNSLEKSNFKKEVS